MTEQPGSSASAAEPGLSAEERAELERLRREVTELRAERAAAPPAHPGAGLRAMRVRKAIAAGLVIIAGFGTVASVVGIWGAKTTLDTDRWVATVAPLPRQPEVDAAVSTFLTTQVFGRLDVQQRLAAALPPKAGFASGPLTEAMEDYVRKTVREFMATDTFQRLWNDANRLAHARIVAILEDRDETVSVQDGVVTLNLLPIVNDLLVAIEQRLPTLFDKKLDLPALTSGQVPAGLRERIQTALGVNLPADFAQIKLYDRDRLGQLQEAMVTFKRTVALLIIGTLVLFASALAVSPNRRRTLLQFGLALGVAVIVLSSVLRGIRGELLAMVPEGVYRDGASAALHQVFTLLRVRGDQLLWIGVAIALLAYMAGPGRLPTMIRRNAAAWAHGAARTASQVGTSDRLRRWTSTNLDPLRIGGILVAAVVALLFTSWTALLLVALALAVYEVLVTLLARSGEAPRLGRTAAHQA